ncbi:glycerophosphodiester phosphodiesterase [Thermoflavimicrobium dichotomicum]|uniref:Glycerophosphoryl diester phosphodiesterase n=1 Tax=Thermoflavimicrobium dichotomicum TaxID=46223 RepID=A0A1I3LZQ0_9BACL|nr:glycerophosphodiester phosphodiesterase family protein [Thermoflavimicrobium dichotomicum]SFI89916.1 glycerophosphoryl diester phosphodiesterase [Thermoflavimicrobium dichotomicum]
MIKKMSKFLLSTALITGLFTSVLSSQANATQPSTQEKYRVETIAHRGASGYAPENTMSAFRKAEEMKADYFELDVQMSKDGHLVVIHDTTVNRTTNGTGNVKDLTLTELRQLDAGSKFNPTFAGEKIPTFDEVLEEFRGKIGILIELKAPELYPGIEEKVAQALKKHNMHKPKNEKIIVQSFNFESMKKFHQLLPEVPVGVLTSDPNHLSDAKIKEFATYANYVNPNLKIVNKQVVENIHAHGMKVQSWTVRSRSAVQPLLDAKVDGIITDYPDYVPRNKSN